MLSTAMQLIFKSSVNLVRFCTRQNKKYSDRPNNLYGRAFKSDSYSLTQLSQLFLASMGQHSAEISQPVRLLYTVARFIFSVYFFEFYLCSQDSRVKICPFLGRYLINFYIRVDKFFHRGGKFLHIYGRIFTLIGNFYTGRDKYLQRHGQIIKQVGTN